MPTISDIKDQFSQLTGLESRDLDAHFWQLLCHYADQTKMNLVLENTVGEEVAEKCLDAAKLIDEGLPLAYIIGETEFYNVKLKVDSSVLIPRNETEELVSWILNDHKLKTGLTLLDIGTGSGCIAIAIASNSNWKVVGVDSSLAALELAEENAIQNKVEIDLHHLNILEQDYSPQRKATNIIVSNPPYIPLEEQHKVGSDTLRYEPEEALFTNDSTGLIFYEKIISDALTEERPLDLYFEINEFRKTELEQLCHHLSLKVFEFRKDIFDKWRMLKISL